MKGSRLLTAAFTIGSLVGLGCGSAQPATAEQSAPMARQEEASEANPTTDEVDIDEPSSIHDESAHGSPHRAARDTVERRLPAVPIGSEGREIPPEMVSLAAEPVSFPPAAQRERLSGALIPAHRAIHRELRQRVRSIMHCYERFIDRGQSPATRLEVTLRIEPTGEVDATVETGDPEQEEVARCIEARLEEIRFSPEEFDSEGVIVIRWPFLIHPAQ